MQLKEIINRLSVLNYDNGSRFTVRDRLDAISDILRDTDYKRVNDSGLFEMYALNGRVPKNAVLVSSHIDCVPEITKCFARDSEDGFLHGTFDNLITNAVIVFLMTRHMLDENVVIAFTGDEERWSQGARDVVRFMRGNRSRFCSVILDVTDMGWEEEAMFTVENNFWSDKLGKRVIDISCAFGYKWLFVPSDPDDIPDYVPDKNNTGEEALCDESWEYDEEDIECFSLCIPCEGEMHANSGLLIRKESLEKYTEILTEIVNTMTQLQLGR